jgi:hypothetical protein
MTNLNPASQQATRPKHMGQLKPRQVPAAGNRTPETATAQAIDHLHHALDADGAWRFLSSTPRGVYRSRVGAGLIVMTWTALAQVATDLHGRPVYRVQGHPHALLAESIGRELRGALAALPQNRSPSAEQVAQIEALACATSGAGGVA